MAEQPCSSYESENRVQSAAKLHPVWIWTKLPPTPWHLPFLWLATVVQSVTTAPPWLKSVQAQRTTGFLIFQPSSIQLIHLPIRFLSLKCCWAAKNLLSNLLRALFIGSTSKPASMATGRAPLSPMETTAWSGHSKPTTTNGCFIHMVTPFASLEETLVLTTCRSFLRCLCPFLGPNSHQLFAAIECL